MALTREQSISLYGVPNYVGWGETEAMYDARSKGLSGGNTNTSSFGSAYNTLSSSIDKYVSDLMDFAKDDYDFAAKWIERQYTDAMGTDDAARKEFLKSVANSLEDKIGTIAFDNQTQTYRLKEDTTKALNRLNEDEATAKSNFNIQTNLEKEQQNSNLNQRGLIAGTRDNATGLAGKNIRTLNEDINNRFDALNRVYQRGSEDINTTSTRGLEDITTGSRRAAAGAQDTKDYSLEAAQRERQRRELEAEQTKKQQKDYLASLGAYIG